MQISGLALVPTVRDAEIPTGQEKQRKCPMLRTGALEFSSGFSVCLLQNKIILNIQSSTTKLCKCL